MTETLIEALMVLVPGFVSAGVYFGLTSHPKPSMFERIVQAIVFTVVVWAVAAALGLEVDLDLRSGEFGAAILLGIAILVGFVAAVVVNTDYLHRFLRSIRVTKENSHPTEWYSSFYSRVGDEFVVLHLVDGRRLYGWPAEWPTDPERGHFRIEDGEWLPEDANASNEAHRAAKFILVRVDDVSMVEFVTPQTEGESDGNASN